MGYMIQRSDLEALVQTLTDRVEAVFLKDGRHAPIALVVEADGTRTVALLAVDTPSARRAFFESACAQGRPGDRIHHRGLDGDGQGRP